MLKLALALNALLLILSSHSYGEKIDPIATCVDKSSELTEKLSCIPDLDFKEVVLDPAVSAGLRQYEMNFKQLIDHGNPSLGTFNQRVVLLHRRDSEPMVLQTSGYSIFGVRETALMKRFGTNQIQVEHRYFSGSTPEPKDWSKLNAKQSADDFHNIVVQLKKIYKGPWIGTGASKGGMTSVYHRYFYPNDLTGTVADVAPLSFSKEDERYIDFVKNVGGNKYASCRDKFSKLQRYLIDSREQVLPLISGNFSQLGSADVALEHSVLESQFVFWQYQNPEDPSLGCDQIDSEWSSAKSAFNYLQKVSSIDSYADGEILRFVSYYYQAATELGSPGTDKTGLEDALKYEFTIDQYIPKGLEYTYSNDLMLKVKEWTTKEAKDIVFVYGEFDPWTAGAFPLGRTENNVHHFTVKGGNHGSKFTLLDPKQKTAAESILSAWFGKSPVLEPLVPKNGLKSNELKKIMDQTEDLESLEFKMRRTLRL